MARKREFDPPQLRTGDIVQRTDWSLNSRRGPQGPPSLSSICTREWSAVSPARQEQQPLEGFLGHVVPEMGHPKQ